MNKDGKNRPRNRLGNKIVILGYVPYTMFDVGVSYFLQKKNSDFHNLLFKHLHI